MYSNQFMRYCLIIMRYRLTQSLVCKMYVRTSRQVDGVIKNVTRILVSVVYTYSIIKEAAKSVQASDRWINNEKIQALEFSTTWIHKFLKRANMRRRKITTDDKNVPSDEEVRRIMSIGQQMY